MRCRVGWKPPEQIVLFPAAREGIVGAIGAIAIPQRDERDERDERDTRDTCSFWQVKDIIILLALFPVRVPN